MRSDRLVYHINHINYINFKYTQPEIVHYHPHQSSSLLNCAGLAACNTFAGHDSGLLRASMLFFVVVIFGSSPDKLWSCLCKVQDMNVDNIYDTVFAIVSRSRDRAYTTLFTTK
jgi:hypothetical protein